VKFPFVVLPRSVYDDLVTDRRTMLDLLATLKKDGFAGRTSREPTIHLPSPPPEEVALAEAEKMAINAMTDDFMRNGLTREAAETEARRVAVAFSQSHPQQLY
jgi:hypothetical protein